MSNLLIISNIIVLQIILLHILFLILEMFYWDKPLGLKIFRQSKETAKVSKILAANQGLYNGFLASGLIWGLLLGKEGTNVKIFFLCCIFIAGIFGGFTANKRIILYQALPASIALILIFLN